MKPLHPEELKPLCWAVVNADPNNMLAFGTAAINLAAYVVSFGTSKDEPKPDPLQVRVGDATPTNDKQIANWNALKISVSEAMAAEVEAQTKLCAFENAHLLDHPLSPEACNTLRDAVRNGAPLCCEKGRTFLATVVDPIWAEVINEWAYESFMCRGSHNDSEEHLRRLNGFLSKQGCS